MKEHSRVARISLYVFTAVAASALGAGVARAQTPPPVEAAPPPAPAAMPAATPPPPAPPPPMPPPPASPPPTATATESMPATRPDVLPPIDVGAWVRASSLFQGADPSKINDWHMNNAYVELHTGGKITKNVGVTLNLNANITNGTTGGFDSPMTDGSSPGSSNFVAIEDAIISFDIVPEFHVWAGHLLVMVDRSNSSGPFFMIPWNYPGFLGVGGALVVGAPKEGPSGRNNGVNVWGDIAGGKLTYFAGVYDNGSVNVSPLFSGRLRLALLDPETGFWGNGSYFGGKDILSFDLGGQAQGTQGTPAGSKTYADVNVDGLFEKKIPGGSWFTAEGAYYHFNVNDGGVSNSLYVLAAYASPTVGIGNIQPMVRYQWADIKGNTGTNPWNLDAAVAYLMKGPALRLIATYSYTKLAPGIDANAIQLGAQAIFF
jgi:hypothetical protein